MIFRLIVLLLFLSHQGFSQHSKVTLTVLGTTQDAGAPQMVCEKECCASLSLEEQDRRKASSLALRLEETASTFLFDASPDISIQWNALIQRGQNNLAGIFLTHAHMGHYAGLLHLGREAWNSDQIPVYAMPRMKAFIENNAPWELLISLENINITQLESNRTVSLGLNVQVTPVPVPHRDEYSETVAYWIQGPNKSALYLPDIDKWERWETAIEEWIAKVDYAFLDATFFDRTEVPRRSMEEIPHPFVVESVKRFDGLSPLEKKKIYFIHMNHTNPLLNPKSRVYQKLIHEGFVIAERGMEFSL